MPVRIDSDENRYIHSSAERLLEQELRNYREEKIKGRSFLIAGHRGAGKTSLVIKALQSVGDETSGPLARRPRRFLLIYIHGPSMFSADDEGSSGASASAPNKAPITTSATTRLGVSLVN